MGLRRTIDVDQRSLGVAPEQRADRRRELQRFAADVHLPQIGQRAMGQLGRVGQLSQRDERQDHARYALAAQKVEHHGGLAARRLWHDHEATTDRPGRKDLLETQIEAEPIELKRPLLGRSARVVELPGDQVGQAPVRHRAALGPAGRTRRVDDVGEVIGIHRNRRARDRHVRLVFEEQVIDLRPRAAEVAVGQDQSDPRVLDDVRHALLRLVRRDARYRHQRQAGLVEREQCDEVIDTAAQHHADTRIASAGNAQQAMREPIRPGLQLVEREHLAVEHDRRSIWRSIDLLLEPSMRGLEHQS